MRTGCLRISLNWFSAPCRCGCSASSLKQEKARTYLVVIEKEPGDDQNSGYSQKPRKKILHVIPPYRPEKQPGFVSTNLPAHAADRANGDSVAKTTEKQVTKQEDNQHGSEADTRTSAIAPSAIPVISAASANQKDDENDENNQHGNFLQAGAGERSGPMRLLLYDFLDISDFFLNLAPDFLGCSLGFEIGVIGGLPQLFFC
jgi:hypothetical protein